MAVWLPRVSMILITFVLLSVLRKIHRYVYFERRLRRYSVNNSKDDISFMDKLYVKYRKFLSKHENDEKLKKYSRGYKKYITLGENDNPIYFLLNKLVIGFAFTVLVVISGVLSGRLVYFWELILSFIIGYYFYDIYLYYSSRHKRKKIKNDMLRAVILLNNSFKAGKSILQSVLIASQELPKPISQEFGRIYQDMVYGLSADVAFMRFSKRVGLEEANYIASSLAILNKTGGNIVTVFTTIEKTLFDRKKLENDLKTSSAASNLVVKFLMGIPIVFVLVICVFNPTYFEPLFQHPLGYFLLFVMWIMFIIYIYLLNKIMKVKV